MQALQETREDEEKRALELETELSRLEAEKTARASRSQNAESSIEQLRKEAVLLRTECVL